MAWLPTNTVAEWGQIRVVVGGKDVTFFRSTETVVGGWQDTDPYGSNNASLSFPQVTEFDEIGVGDLDWLDEGKLVRIDHHNDGARIKTLFIGFLGQPEITDGGVSVTCLGDLLGDLTIRMHQPPIGRTKARDYADAVREEIGADDGVGRFDVNPFTTGMQTRMRGDRGMTKLGFVDSCLGYAIKANGDSLTILPDPSKSATAYRLGWRDLTTRHATVHAGAHGVKVRLSRDILDNPKRLFAEATAPGGERWRNAKYPRLHNDVAPAYPMAAGASFGLGTTNADTSTGDGITVLVRELAASGALDPGDKFTDTFTDEVEDAVKEVQERAGMTEDGIVTPAVWDRIFNVGDGPKSFAGAMFWPLAQDKRTHRFLRSADGTVIGLNPDYDASVRPVEAFESLGENVTKREGRRYMKAKMARNSGWAGTVTLTSDPAEMSRFDLRAGMNIKVEHLKGALNQLLHISSVQVDWQSGTVTLAVSTQGRHYLDLATRKERNREARRDPGMAFRHMLRRSAQTSDAISGWEGESGAGIITPTPLTGGTWNPGIPVVACEVGTMSRLRLVVDGPTTYYVMLMATRVPRALLNQHIGDPSAWADVAEKIDVFTANADWLVSDTSSQSWAANLLEQGQTERLMIEAWGTPDQPCGLWPKPYLNPAGDRSTAPINGKHYDGGSWDFWTADNFLYLYVWPAADCTISGRMRIQINEGA